MSCRLAVCCHLKNGRTKNNGGMKSQSPWIHVSDALPDWMRAHSPAAPKSSGLTGGSASNPCFAGSSKYSVTSPSEVWFVIGLGMGYPPCVLCGRCGRVWRAVDVIKGEVVAQGLCVGDQALSRVRRDGLAPLVVAYISLRATDALGKCGLGRPQSFANGFDRVHGEIVVPLLAFVNSGAVSFF